MNTNPSITNTALNMVEKQMTNPFRLDDQLALVTGGGTGLGLATGQALINAGARVIITGRRIEPLKQACRQLGDQAYYLQQDVADLPSIPNFVNRVETQFGPLDILVNNAGNHLKKPVVEMTDQDFDLVLQTHLYGSFALSREFGRRMVKRKSGSIAMILSMATFLAIPNVAGYTVSKTALLGLIRALTAEFSAHNVRVNGVAPGWFETEMTEKTLNSDPARKAKVMGRIPMKRFGDPLDVGNAIVFLSSPAAQYITGAVLPVDGGGSIGF